MRIEAARKHPLGLGRLAGFALHPAVLRFQPAGRLPATAAEHGASRGRAPVFEFPRLLKYQPEEWPLEIGIPALLLRVSCFLQHLARHRLAAQHHRDRILIVDRRLVGQRALQRVGLLVQGQRPRRRRGSFLCKERDRADHARHCYQQTDDSSRHKKASPIEVESGSNVDISAEK